MGSAILKSEAKEILLPVSQWQKVNIELSMLKTEIAHLRTLLQDDTISVGIGKETLQIKSNEILYLKSSSNYCEFTLRNGQKYLTSKTLKYWESKLNPAQFVRCHSSYLVALSDIFSFSKSEKWIKLTNGETIPISRQKAKLFS